MEASAAFDLMSRFEMEFAGLSKQCLYDEAKN
jgi:hypothetical protein